MSALEMIDLDVLKQRSVVENSPWPSTVQISGGDPMPQRFVPVERSSVCALVEVVEAAQEIVKHNALFQTTDDPPDQWWVPENLRARFIESLSKFS